MSLDQTHLPLALIAGTFLGGLIATRLPEPRHARAWVVSIASLTLLGSVVLAWAARSAPTQEITGFTGFFGVDALSGLIVPLVALLGWTLSLAAPRSWATQRALGRLLVNVSLLHAALLCRDARVLALLWAATLVPTWLELGRTPGATRAHRVFGVYAVASAVAFAVGIFLLGTPLDRIADVWHPRAWSPGGATPARVAGLVCILAAVFIRKAALPFHSWLAPVFAAAPPGPVLLLVAPMLGPYVLLRLAVPLFPELLGDRWFVMGPLALLTAAYGAGLAFVQTELRRVVAWLVLSQSALVLVGLECPEGAGLTGGLTAWLSTGSAMMGMGLSAWMLEARFGPLSIDKHHGLYPRGPALALVFLLSGLSLVAFPGTVGFVSADLLLRAILESFPQAGLLVFFATALNGFTVLRAYMRLFHGKPAPGRELGLRKREWFALIVPLALLVWQGLHPAPLLTLGADASRQLLKRQSDR